jgi:protein transport protein SEC13
MCRDDASVWKVRWAHHRYGRVLAIGSFKKKVAIFQEKGNDWIEIAFHTEHEGSVNSLNWAPVSFGLKLFAGGSDGKVSIIELQGNGWGISSFQAHEWAINSIAIESDSLNEEEKKN